MCLYYMCVSIYVYMYMFLYIPMYTYLSKYNTMFTLLLMDQKVYPNFSKM